VGSSAAPRRGALWLQGSPRRPLGGEERWERWERKAGGRVAMMPPEVRSQTAPVPPAATTVACWLHANACCFVVVAAVVGGGGAAGGGLKRRSWSRRERSGRKDLSTSLPSPPSLVEMAGASLLAGMSPRAKLAPNYDLSIETRRNLYGKHDSSIGVLRRWVAIPDCTKQTGFRQDPTHRWKHSRRLRRVLSSG
jgi:hypothetical protein